MSFLYELLRAGTTSTDSDSGAEVARKINENFKKVKDQFAEIELSIKNGVSANIPIGTETQIGGVKSSRSENNVFIRTDGTMEVNSLNVQKIEQDDGDYLILDGNI